MKKKLNTEYQNHYFDIDISLPDKKEITPYSVNLICAISPPYKGNPLNLIAYLEEIMANEMSLINPYYKISFHQDQSISQMKVSLLTQFSLEY